MNLPAWDEITSSDEWTSLSDSEHREVFRSYLADISKVKDFKELSGKEKFAVIRAMQTDAGLYQEEKPEGLMEGFVKPTLKAIPKVVGATAGSMALMPVAGLAGLAKTATLGLTEGAKTTEQISSLPQELLDTPEEKKGAENIALAMIPFSKAAEGWRMIGEKTGIPYAEPVLGTIGEASAMFGLPGGVAKGRASLNSMKAALDVTGKEPPAPTIKPPMLGQDAAKSKFSPELAAQLAQKKPLALPPGQGFEIVGDKPRGFDVAPRSRTIEMPYIPKEVLDQLPLKEEAKTTVPQEVLDQIPLRENPVTEVIKERPPNAGEMYWPESDDARFILDDFKSQLRNAQTKSVTEVEGETFVAGSAYPQWFRDMSRKNGISAKETITIIDKYLSGKKELTDRQADIFGDVVNAAQKERDAYGPMLERMKAGQEGFTEAQKVVAGNLKVGDEVIRNGEKYKVTNEDAEGNLTLKDGETIKVDPFDVINVEGVKKGQPEIKRGIPEVQADIPGTEFKETFDLSNPETEISRGLKTHEKGQETTTLFSGIDPTRIPAMYRKVMESKPMRAIVGFFDPSANIPQGKEFMYSRQGAKGSIALGEKLADSFVKKYKGLKPEERTAIWEQMNSGAPIESLPQNLQAPAKVFRQIDNTLGKMLVDEGLMSEETYKANEGNHIRHIYNIYQEGGDLAGGMGQKLDTKFLKSRKDMTDLERQRLGLVKDPLQAIAQSITDTYRAVGMSQHFRTIASNPDWVFSPSDVVIDGKKMGIGKVQKMLDAYTQVEKAGSKLNPEQLAYRDKLQTALKDAEAVDVPKDYIKLDGAQYGELDGRYVKKEIAQDIKPILDVFKTSSAGTNKAVSAIVAANGLWKMKNVALNVPTAARNTISNPIQLVMSGMRPDHVVTRTVEAISEMAKDGKYYNEALRQGQFKTNFTTGELEDILAIAKDFDSANWVHFMSKVQNLGKYYGKIDDVFKLAKFIDERKAGKSAQEAAYQANKWVMDYSFTHPAIKVLRNSPIGAPFISYQYKVAPLIAESLKKRPWVIASIMSIPMLLQKQITKDMTDEEAKKFIESLPEYVQNKQVFLIPGTHGMNALDISYMVPWGNWYQVANSVKDEKITKAFKQMGIASGLLPSLMYGVTTGKDLFTNKDIVDPLNQYDNKAAAWDMTKWIWQQAAPPMLTETSVAGKVSEHLQHGQTSKGLKTEGMNVWPRVVGVNIYPVDPTGKSRGERYEIRNVRKALARKIYDKNLSPKEREAARQAYMMAVKEIRKIEPEQTEAKQFD